MTRKGFLRKINDNWVVRYPKYPTSDKIFEWGEIPLTPDDEEKIKDPIEPMEGKEVSFDLVDEFTHPQYYQMTNWGNGITFAKLSKI